MPLALVKKKEWLFLILLIGHEIGRVIGLAGAIRTEPDSGGRKVDSSMWHRDIIALKSPWLAERSSSTFISDEISNVGDEEI